MDALPDYLRDHRLAALFIDALGWDRATGARVLAAGDRSLCFQTIAHKRGLQVLWCSADRVALANRALLRKFQDQIARIVHEHILIFSCEEPRKQVWAWCVHQPDGRKLRHREHPFFSVAPPPCFLNRLDQLRFTLEEEEGVSLVDALHRVRRVLDVSSELDLFAKRPWYAAKSDELAKAMQQGDLGAFRCFVLFHLGLARKISKRLCRWFGMPAEDAEQIAVIGLIQAARRFRPERGVQFSTYATWWIRQACQRFGPEVALLIRVPLYAFWECFRHSITLDRLRQAAGPSGVRNHLSELELINPKLAARWLAYIRARNVGTLSDPSLLSAAQTIPAPIRTPLEDLRREEESALVRTAVQRLRPRDAQVIRLRYGLGDRVHTLEEIGRQMGLTRERIRQIEERAKLKLRNLLQEGAFPPTTADDAGELASLVYSAPPASEEATAPASGSVLILSQDIRDLSRTIPDKVRISPQGTEE